MAGSQIKAGAAYVELFLKDNKLNKGLASAQKRLQAWGGTVTSTGLKVFAAGAALRAPFEAVVKIAADMGSELVDMRAKTGVSIEALSELGYAAQVSGSDLESLQGGLTKMQKKVGEAFNGVDSAAESFNDLGISVAELKSLSPDKQFQRVADAVADITDPAKRTAAAMDIFGKSGANLLPLLLEGGDGIDELRQKAIDLGLQIGTKDAEAAEEFGDKLDTLWKQLKGVAFTVGSALIPGASDLADRLMTAATKTIDWVKANRELVVWVAKIAAGVMAAGAALVVIGGAMSMLGSVIGVGIAAVSGLGAVVGTVGSVLAALLSPVALVAAAVVGLAGYFLWTSGEIARAVDWLQGVWGTLKGDALGAFQGIKDALAAGDFALAAKVLWASLRLVFQRGVGALMTMWADWKAFFKRIWTEAVFSAASIFVNAWAGIQNAFSSVTGFLSDAWLVFTGMLTRTWHNTVGFIKKAWVKLKGLFNKDVNVEAEVSRINKETEEATTGSQQSQDEALMKAEEARKRDAAKIEAQRKGTLGALGEDKQREHDKISNEQNASVAALEKELADLQKERDELLAKAKGGADAAARNKLGELDGREANIKNRLAGAGEEVGAQKDKIQGTFSAAVAGRFGTSSADRVRKQIAENTKKTHDNTKKIADKVDKLGLTATSA